jgi:AmmeMemoRadiSam system protein B
MRKPAVAFQFYPGDPTELEQSVSGFIEEQNREEVLALIAPHAGYVYSGKVAGSVYSRVMIPDDVILLGPNHTGYGEAAAVMTSGNWEMPFGSVSINESLASILVQQSKLLTNNSLAHVQEHSLEVQLPFLHYINPNVKIVPITLMHLNYDHCVEIGLAIAKSLKKYPSKVILAVSSDMNHYESQEITKGKDKAAIEKVLEINPEALYHEVKEKGISMCGMIPATIALVACKELGAKEARLIKYATSGDVSGDYNQVVGYAGIVIK